MNITNEQTLYYALLNAKTRTQVSNVLSQLGDSEEVRPLTPLKPMGLCWFPFGGREANIATINVATHAGRSLTERITNAMDAVLEEGYDREQKAEATPRIAAEKWFRRPQSGPDTGLFKIDYTKSGLSKLLSVVLLDSGFDDGPTIDVVDSGIGIPKERFPETILSLNENNKLKKSYVSGRFGQGGSSTLGFSEFVVIFSRSKHKTDEVTFTHSRTRFCSVVVNNVVLALTTKAESSLRSFPTALRPETKASTTEVPPPIYGSSTTSPGEENRSIAAAANSGEKRAG